jgi:hypothetical protein
VSTDKNVKAIKYNEVPNIIFGPMPEGGPQDGYRYFNAPELENMFTKSTKGKSAVDEIEAMLYKYGYCAESVTISTIPIYYLEPNTTISINDPKTGINGSYDISKISIPLTYNGTMSITATRTPPQLY